MVDEISQLAEIVNRSGGNYKDFTSRIGYALQLGLKEKEIFFFGVMQWVAIIIACLLWVQILFWIPQPVWESMNACDARGEEDCSAAITMPLMIWGWVCILLAAFPVGILSSAMGTAHFLHKSGQESTVLKCLHVAFSNAWITWSFHYVDGLITVRQIISRFPSDNDHRTPAQVAAEEAAYYAWKVGSAGMLPNIVLGNGLVLSAKNSLKFLKANVGGDSKIKNGLLCHMLGSRNFSLHRWRDFSCLHGRCYIHDDGSAFIWRSLSIFHHSSWHCIVCSNGNSQANIYIIFV